MSKYLTSSFDFRKILATLYFAGCFIFFAFFYQYHLYHIEQVQLFRLSRDYIMEYFHKPASISSLIGDFLTQFYFLKFGGAVIITGCLFLLWYLLDSIISILFSWKHSYIFSFLATAIVTSLHFSIYYPLGATISIILALVIFRFYILFTGRNRIICGLILVPVLYLATGFAVHLFLLLVLLYELKLKQIKSWLRWAYIFILILIVLILPVSVRSYFYLTARQAYQYPINELIKPIPDFKLESWFSLDCEWYFNHPDKVIKLARKYPRLNLIVSYYHNLASAAVNKLPENLLLFNQQGMNGMFIPYNYGTDYISVIFGNEVYYFIGDINASQHFALMANTGSPKCASSRMTRRLVETNIINGEYAAAGKYIKMLKQTIFHRQWAHNMEQYLYNDELCSSTPWIARKRAQIPLTDHINADTDYFISTLYYLLEDHPDNRAALDYFLCSCLLHKDIVSFYNAIMDYGYPEINLPELYQEALIVYFEQNKEDKNFKNFRFSNKVIQHLMSYEKKFYQSKGNKKALVQDFGSTYWFYYHFADVPGQK
jgi:hypothetical protein